MHEEADDENDAAMWERLRSRAGVRESQLPPAPASEGPRYSGFRPATAGGHQAEGEYSHYETDGNADPYAQYAQHAQHAEEESYETYEQYSQPESNDSYAQDQLGYEPQHEAYGQPQHDGYAQQHDAYAQQHDGYAQQHNGYAQQHDAYQQSQHDAYAQQQAYAAQQQAHAAQQSPYGQVAAYGSVVPPQPQLDSQAWAGQASAPVAALDHGEPSGRLRSRWMTPAIMALVGILGAGAASYQFVVLPRQQKERAAALAELQVRQQKLIDEQAAAEAVTAKAEAEQKAATEAALARADEAAAAAAPATPEAKAGGSAKAKAVTAVGETKAEKKARERHERRAAKKSGSHERSAKASKAEPEEKAAPVAKATKKGKKAEGGAMVETDNNDPLFGL